MINGFTEFMPRVVAHGFYKDAMRARCEAVLGATSDRKEEAPDFGQFRYT